MFLLPKGVSHPSAGAMLPAHKSWHAASVDQ